MQKTHFSWCINTYFWLTLLLCGSATAESTPHDQRLTLKSAIAKTLAHNPELYQYRFTNKTLNAEKQNSGLRPALALEIGVENFAGSGALNSLDSAEITLALSSTIELGGKRNARLAYADARINQAKADQKAATLDTLGNLTELYIRSLATQANVHLAEASLTLSRSTLQTIETRSARGASPEAEVMRAKASLVHAQISLAAVKAKFDRQRVYLARYWGEKNPSFSVLDGSLFSFGANTDFDKLFARIQSSPALKTLASKARIRDVELRLARASSQSDLSWRAGIRRLEETGESAFIAEFSMPLFSGDRSSGAVKAAIANRDAVDFERKDLSLELHARLYEAWSLRLQSITAVQQMRKISIPALEKALSFTKKGFDNGRYRYMELMAAQKELLASKQALIDSATTVLISQAAIERLTGEAFAH